MGYLTQSRVAKGLPLALAVAGCMGLSAAVSAAPRFDWFQTPKHLFVMLPPTVIASGEIGQSQWSGDGSYLMVCASPATTSVAQMLTAFGPGATRELPNSLYVFERSTGSVRKLWEANDPHQSIGNIDWLTKSHTALVTLQTDEVTPELHHHETYSVMAIDAANGRHAFIPGMDRLLEPPSFILSPTSTLALAVFADVESSTRALAPVAAAPDQAAANVIPSYRPLGTWVFPGVNNFWMIGPDAEVLHRIHTGPAPLAGIQWGVDGRTWYFATEDRKSKERFIQHLEDDGKLTTVKVPIYTPAPEPKPELWLHDKPMKAHQRKTARGFNNLWISSPEDTPRPDALVTPNGSYNSLSPAGNAVFYIEAGVAKVRNVEVVSGELKDALERAIKAQVVSDAKQAALGLLMYSADMDDNLPGLGNLDALDPYLKGLSVLDDFNYTPPTDLLVTHIAEPANTQIGYIEGPGGRAVAYSDGHVKWIPNP